MTGRIPLAHRGTALCAAACWSAVWMIIGASSDIGTRGVGNYLACVFALSLLAVTLLTPLVASLSAPLVTAAPATPPATPPVYGPPPPQAPPVAAPPAPPEPAPFKPFWFAVPETRAIAPVDGGGDGSARSLVPGTWYLAVARRGDGLVARSADGVEGLLADTVDLEIGPV